MKNLKVKTKMNLVIIMVALLAICCAGVSTYSMIKIKKQALSTMETSIRTDYDDSIKTQVQTAISLLNQINTEYTKGQYTLDQAKKLGADEIRALSYGEKGYFWVDQTDGTNVVLLGSKTEGTNRLETKDAKGFQMVKEMINLSMSKGGGFTDYYFPKPNETTPLPKRAYTEYFKPFSWVVGTGNYTDYIDKEIVVRNAELGKEVTNSLIIFAVVSIFIFLFAAGIILLISNDIKNTLKKISEYITEISKGDFVKKADSSLLNRKDDFGMLAGAMEKMRESMHSLISSIKEEASRITNVVSTIDKNVNELNSEMEDVSATTQELSATMEETAASSEQISTMSHDIETAANNISKRAQEGAEQAKKIDIRAWIYAKMDVRHPGGRGDPGVGYNHFCPFVLGLLGPAGDDGVRLGEVGANGKDALRVFQVQQVVGHGSGAKRRSKAHYGRRMASLAQLATLGEPRRRAIFCIR